MVLLRRYTADRDGDRRPHSFHLASRTDFTLSDTFRVAGKSCIVTLEEDHISWVPRKASGKKEGEIHTRGHNIHTSSSSHPHSSSTYSSNSNL